MSSKSKTYQNILSDLEHLIEPEADIYSNLGNTAAILHDRMKFDWTGFYIVRKNELVLGPFQGPVACTRIAFGKGVCGSSWKEKSTQLVDDVNKLENYIACSGGTQSEIVVPLFTDDQNVWAVLDIDSNQLSHFDKVDQEYLEKIAGLLSAKIVYKELA